jgi:hypothetical protein
VIPWAICKRQLFHTTFPIAALVVNMTVSIS